ncbi:sugar ABC transporter permease [Marinitoga hydrogenitolerans]
MIQKKNYILRHIFLIIVLVIVLFPLVWVVTTSIRRDNAAFSPKLFSSRITLNYYRDLLFPRATVPELIKDINGTVHFIGENSKLSLDEASEKLMKELTAFETYISQTNDYLNDIASRFENINNAIQGDYKKNILDDINKSRNNEHNKLLEMEKTFLVADISTIKNDIVSLENEIKDYYESRIALLNILNSINQTNENKKYYQNTLDTIFSIKPNYTLWNIKTYKKWIKIEQNENIKQLPSLIKALSNKWKSILAKVKDINNKFYNLEKQKLGDDLNILTSLEKEITETQKSISLIKSDISKTESLVAKYNSDLSSLLELYVLNSSKIESAVNIFQTYKNKKINSNKVMALSDSIKNISNKFEIIKNNMENLADFEIYKEAINKYYTSFLWLKDNLEYINPDLEYVSPAYKTLVETTNSINSTLDTLNFITTNLKDNLSKLEKYQNSLTQLSSQLENIKNKYAEIYNKNKETLDNFAKLKKYGEFTILKTFTNLDINNYYESEYLADLLNSKLFEYYKPSKKDLNIFTLRKNINEATEKFLKSKASFENIMLEISPNLEKIKSNSYDYLKINYGGYTADISPILEISAIYNSKFGPAKANISRASRIVSDLSDSVKYKTLKSDLRTIDGNIYNLLDNWNPKQRKPFLRWLLNSIIVAGVTSILTVLMTAVAAYPFSRMRFFGRKEGLLYLMLIQMFPAIMYMIALYGILKFMGDYFGFIGLDTLTGLIFVYLGGVSFNMWLIKGYYDTIPDSLEESAMIDGATRFQTFWRIVLPLASPILAVVTILSFMGTFNEFVMARIVLSSEQNYTYAVGLQTFTSGPFETEWGLFTAAALLGAVPMVLLFLSMQKYLVGGLTQGSVKG